MPTSDYKVIKLKLNQVLKYNDPIQDKIVDAVQRTNTIVRSAMYMFKDYTLQDPEKIIPTIDANLLDMMLQSVCVTPTRGRKSTTNASLKNKLKDYYRNQFATLHGHGDQVQPNYKHLNTVLDYEALSWLTSLENNIKQRYVTYVEAFVNHNFKGELESIVSNSNDNAEMKTFKKNAFHRKLRKFKNALLDIAGEKHNLTEDEMQWVKDMKKLVLPDKKSFEMNSIPYDLECNPIDYMLPMLHMMELIEHEEMQNQQPESEKDTKDETRLKNVFPLRTSLIPKHIRIDTTTLCHLTQFKPCPLLNQTQHSVWEEYFRTHKYCFRYKGYRFNNSIMTDGISCCILFIKDDLYGKRYKPGKKSKRSKEPYLDELDPETLSSFRTRKVVGLDPNMGNLMYCSDENDNTLRYTHAQRKFDMKTKKYNLYRTRLKKIHVIEEKTVEEWEKVLSNFNHKTLVPQSYRDYLKIRFMIDKKLSGFYDNTLYRLLSLQTYRNGKHSESHFMKRFEDKFGRPDEVIIGFGDWEQKQHRKYKEPVKGKGNRLMLRKYGYETYLVDEYKTSKQCNGCKDANATTATFLKKTYVKKGKTHSQFIHGLLKCKTCNRVWNRDVNSSRNQRDITRHIINGETRPSFLQRNYTT